MLLSVAMLAIGQPAPARTFDVSALHTSAGGITFGIRPTDEALHVNVPSGAPYRSGRPVLYGEQRQLSPRDGTEIIRLRHLIGFAEARRYGYDAVHHGAKLRPAAPPSRMTLAEVFAWIDATPGQNHAIGRYQFIPKTLRRLVRRARLHSEATFTPQVQDALADLLLQDAGLDDFLAGELPRAAFMNNLAEIWAGLPNDSGRSHYHGYAGNRAMISWGTFDREIAFIFGD